jgi:hypothetical protein
MRTILLGVTLLCSALVFVPTIFAQTASSSARGALKTAVQDQRMTVIKQKSTNEIDRRISSLNGLLTKFSSVKKLPEEDKTLFTTQIQDYISQLTALKTKIEADTDLSALRLDARSIFTNFRVYAIFMPKLAELSAVDRMGVAADTLTDVASKLQTLITQLKNDGKDVSILENLLIDMNAKIAEARTVYQAVEAEITPVAPDGYPANLTTLKDGRTKLKTGAASLRAAWNDAVEIRRTIKSLESTSSASPAATSSATTP